jgi:hypothetical protein
MRILKKVSIVIFVTLVTAGLSWLALAVMEDPPEVAILLAVTFTGFVMMATSVIVFHNKGQFSDAAYYYHERAGDPGKE